VLQSACACLVGYDVQRGPNECTKCAAGKYKNTAAGGELCLDCPAGNFSAVLGATSCDACAAGSYSAAPGASVCTDCQVRAGSPVGSDAVDDCVCEIGYEGVDADGVYTCQACQARFYKDYVQPG